MKAERYSYFYAVLDTVTDNLGRPIDYGIRDCVVGLWLNGVWTLASCEGHDEGAGRRYPIIEIPTNALSFLRKLIVGFSLELIKPDEYHLSIRPDASIIDNLEKSQAEFHRFAEYLHGLVQ